MPMPTNWTSIPDASADIPRFYDVLITVCRKNEHYVAEYLLLPLELLRHLVCHPVLFWNIIYGWWSWVSCILLMLDPHLLIVVPVLTMESTSSMNNLTTRGRIFCLKKQLPPLILIPLALSISVALHRGWKPRVVERICEYHHFYRPNRLWVILQHCHMRERSTNISFLCTKACTKFSDQRNTPVGNQAINNCTVTKFEVQRCSIFCTIQLKKGESRTYHRWSTKSS